MFFPPLHVAKIDKKLFELFLGFSYFKSLQGISVRAVILKIGLELLEYLAQLLKLECTCICLIISVLETQTMYATILY